MYLPHCVTQDTVSACLTFGNELYDEDHRSTHKKSGRLTESPAAVSEQQHGDDESWDLHHRRQEIIQVRVSMKVCGVENESIVRHGDDHPEGENNTCKSVAGVSHKHDDGNSNLKVL